ncbi:MAG TPA: antibiotic biosynthesis monooxygenase [Reyranella sp.]|nr:antibiotic biosynthesis monooxygenase [Reyranella sp.]
MIARTWRARATVAKAPAYARHFTETVVPQLKTLPGHRGAYLLRRELHSGIEFVALTLWESRASIEAFAGKDISRSHVEPEGQAALESFDDFADHYEVATAN